MPNKTWMTDQRLHQIDPHKLDFLQKLVFEMQELSDQDKLPFLMALATSTKKHPVNFSKEEITAAIESLHKGPSIRGEALTLSEFAALSDYFSNIK